MVHTDLLIKINVMLFYLSYHNREILEIYLEKVTVMKKNI